MIYITLDNLLDEKSMTLQTRPGVVVAELAGGAGETRSGTPGGAEHGAEPPRNFVRNSAL
jgi:hypothetical protein